MRWQRGSEEVGREDEEERSELNPTGEAQEEAMAQQENRERLHGQQRAANEKAHQPHREPICSQAPQSACNSGSGRGAD